MPEELKEILVPLLARHKEYVAKWKEHGGRTLALSLPCCKGELEVPTPEKGERQWDSLMACPHCGATVMKVVTYEKATAMLLEDASHG